MEKAEKRGNKGGAALVIRAVIILILALALIVAGCDLSSGKLLPD